jgi:predicted RecB family nuclease
MQKIDGQLVYSPSDLITFMESPFASWMDRCERECPGRYTPDKESEEMRLVAKTGDAHEKAFLEQLRRDRPSAVHEIARRRDPKELPLALAETKAAIATGHEVIYQAYLEKAPFRGYADFLCRSGTGENGQHLYEVWDTKLARRVKPYYLVQLCCYAEMLAGIQGERPETLRVVLGSQEMEAFATRDFFHYYLELKAAFLELMENFDPDNPPEPDPRADHGRWQSHADRWILEQDHLVQVASINVSQIRKLRAAGVQTVKELASLGDRRVPKLDPAIQSRLVEQATLQVQTKKAREKNPDEPPVFRVLPVEKPGSGLSGLPPPSPADVFFDMEGFPLVEGGLEYLFGAATHDSEGRIAFNDWWAHDAAEEKRAFEAFVDWAYARWKAAPQMHIYHYAAYEVSAMRRLMGRYGTREEEIDELLRNEVFVDLYQIVRQGLRIGESSYSIKSVERLYMGKRTGDVATAGQSMVYYANWLESGETRDWRNSPILEKIRSYNKEDCVSTVLLCEWLRKQQTESGIAYVSTKAAPTPDEPDPDVEAERAERSRLVVTLAQKVEQEQDPKTKQLHELFGQLIDFHRRERKPGWWRYFERLKADDEALKDDLECIGGAVLLPESVVQEKKSKIFSYSFDPNQDTKIAVKKVVRCTANPDPSLTVVGIDTTNGILQVKIGDSAIAENFPLGMPVLTSFVPVEAVKDKELKAAVFEMVTRWAAGRGVPKCLVDFLHRVRPDIAEAPTSGAIRLEPEDVRKAAVRCAVNLRDSALCLQGPPGTGKTTTAAAMILALAAKGNNIGITSNSHKAIDNLLLACSDASDTFRAFKVASDNSLGEKRAAIGHIPQTKDAATQFKGGVVGGTAWVFCRPDWENRLDYLFIDEAGQVSLANLVAMARSARNLVILGDQMQLEQPTQGHHPGQSGDSILNYYLEGHATIPEDRGLFLPITHRLQPRICDFVSDMIYEGRLRPAPSTAAHRLVGGSTVVLPKAGLAFVPVEHDGNVQASDEEVACIVRLVAELETRQVAGSNGDEPSKLHPKNLLIVAPYNMQVMRLRAALPRYADRIASVDKFQGQEADVVIVSMCSSFGEYGSRGLEFILDENRLNVALSRARALAVVVGDPRTARSPAATVPAMRRLNLYCRLKQDGAVC